MRTFLVRHWAGHRAKLKNIKGSETQSLISQWSVFPGGAGCVHSSLECAIKTVTKCSEDAENSDNFGGGDGEDMYLGNFRGGSNIWTGASFNYSGCKYLVSTDCVSGIVLGYAVLQRWQSSFLPSWSLYSSHGDNEQANKMIQIVKCAMAEVKKVVWWFLCRGSLF